MTKLLDADGAVVERLHFASDDSFAVETAQDVEPTLEANKRLRADNPSGMGVTREWQHVASIPPVVQMIWLEKYGIRAWDKDHWPAVLRLLNDGEWSLLRTSEGTI
ncbi:hypothetical protein [Inquilinus limosus]|uniref:Uncharacterized protein n=1 Tax=Inquilinus limosus TaxID=171674 RepID=A0A211ZQI0_9PROT|nr:hypothetical protein [Inquilinus limosus]OWJ67444.1 hypothetical protein BWR60_09570 [Inquilinus limosus]